MKFGTFNLDEAVGSILAHGVKLADGVFKKGRNLSVADVAVLRGNGIESVTAAKLEAEDVAEDIAARRVALAVCGNGAIAQQAFTGRANLHSSIRGVLVVDEVRVKALNHIHESLTLATLANFSVVQAKDMLATIKVIPFAVPSDVLATALAIIGDEPMVRVQPFAKKRAGLIISRLPQTKPTLITKSETAMRDRLATLDCSLVRTLVCDHTQDALSKAIADLNTSGCDPILLFGASAIVDRADVIPAGLVAAGGVVSHLGMPVDPGNLLMLGSLGTVPVIGVPSCARSPKVNGFDWVLERVCAGLPVSPSDIMDMGAGGLLAEIPSRPSPRDPKAQSAPRVAAVVLAAGTSSRMGSNKMLADFNGQPMIRTTVENAIGSSVDDVLVVTGNESEKVSAALTGLRCRIVTNADYAGGLATSLRVAIENISADAAIICLGDMPLVLPTTLDQLIAAFNPTEHRTIIVPTFKGQFGNPVLWGAEHFAQLMALHGDRGARGLIDVLKSEAVEIDAATDSVLRDADTPQALADLKATIEVL
jgi:molybdenum cofactor cytidylyltransferase